MFCVLLPNPCPNISLDRLVQRQQLLLFPVPATHPQLALRSQRLRAVSQRLPRRPQLGQSKPNPNRLLLVFVTIHALFSCERFPDEPPP